MAEEFSSLLSNLAKRTKHNYNHMENYDGRYLNLKTKINNHLKRLTNEDRDFYSEMTQDVIIELKTVLADINNVLTFKLTITSANWLCSFFKVDETTKKHILETIDKTKPNTKGFDIHFPEPYKIIAEVKCISPVNNGSKFGAAQWNSILDDFHKLKNGKGKLLDTSDYYKFVFLIDLDHRTDEAISSLLKTSKGISEKPFRMNRHKIKEHIVLLNNDDKWGDLSLEKVYLKKLKLGN